MSLYEEIITIALCAVATMLCRFLPFLIFSEKKPVPKLVQYLGYALPSAIFAMLVVYCIRNVDFLGHRHGLPEILAITLTIGIHLFKRQMLLSIASGTVLYMVLIQML